MFPRKPGKGWQRMGACWSHESGLRVHPIGLFRSSAGELIWADRWPEIQVLARAIREQGGNRRRGLMVWALYQAQNLSSHYETLSRCGAAGETATLQDTVSDGRLG